MIIIMIIMCHFVQGYNNPIKFEPNRNRTTEKTLRRHRDLDSSQSHRNRFDLVKLSNCSACTV